MLPYIIALFGLIKGLAWPAAVVYLLLKFKPELVAELLPRLQELGVAGAKFSAPQEQKAEGPVAPDAAIQPSPKVLRSPAVEVLEGPLRIELEKIDPGNRTDVLLRELAQARLEAGHERIYRLIFGSQIVGLRRLNSLQSVTLAEAREFFEKETAGYQDFYKGYGFDGWLSFLTKNQLVNQTDGQISITPIGRDFLLYLTARRLPELKPG